jgi:transposase, IS6 family
MRDFAGGRSAAKNTLKGIETLRAIKKGHFANNGTGVHNKIEFVSNLFNEAA